MKLEKIKNIIGYLKSIKTINLIKIIVLFFILIFLINKIYLGLSFCLIILSVVLFLDIRNKYVTKINNFNKERVLALVYCLLILNILITILVDNVELGVIGFIIAVTLFYDFKIDSVFLASSSLVLLLYILFLSLFMQSRLIEIIAVYVFYSLTGSLILMIIELNENRKLTLKFGEIVNKLLNDHLKIESLPLMSGIILAITLLNIFFDLKIVKITTIYLFILVTILLIIKKLRKTLDSQA